MQIGRFSNQKTNENGDTLTEEGVTAIDFEGRQLIFNEEVV